MPHALYVSGLWGLGDNVFQRPFIRSVVERHEFSRVYLETPWPEIYRDLPIQFVRGSRDLRTQKRNMARQPSSRWVRPFNAVRRDVRYGTDGVRLHGSCIRAIEACLPLHGMPFVFGLPDFGPSPIKTDKPIALVRPVTVRSEWQNEARNPLPEYVAYAAQQMMATHHVVLVADLAADQEWLVDDELPPHHQALLAGELDVSQLLALAAASDALIGGVGWIVPVAIAFRVPLFVILGGHGVTNSFAAITDPRMDLTLASPAIPDEFCQCTSMRHECNKTISNLPAQFAAWQRKVAAARRLSGIAAASATSPSTIPSHPTMTPISNAM